MVALTSPLVHSRRNFLGTAAALLAVAAAPSARAADPVRIGLIDLALSHYALRGRPRTRVKQMTLWTTGYQEARKQSPAHKQAHADVMAEALADTFAALAPERELILYAASPIMEGPSGTDVIDLDQLAFAYEWFAAQDVRVVAQTFVGNDTAQLRDAMSRAAAHKLVVLASAGNGPDYNPVPPYPAAYPGVVGITTMGLGRAFAAEEHDLLRRGIAGGRDAYVDYAVPVPAFSPAALRRDPELASQSGSSRATVVAAAILGALAGPVDLTDPAAAVAFLDALAVTSGDKVAVLDLAVIKAKEATRTASQGGTERTLRLK